MELDTVVCMEALDFLRSLPDGSVDCVVTDIPYGEVNRSSNGLRKLSKGDADIVTFDLISIVTQIIRATKETVYIFCGWNQISPIIEYARQTMTVRLGIWEKNNPSPQNGEHLWLSSIESCIYARKPGAQFYEHCSSPVWKYPVVNNSIHATQKPVLLMERLIRASSQPGNLICDPFIGSGTTAVAARNLGRHFIGCDISPEYVAIANQRLALPYTPPLL